MDSTKLKCCFFLFQPPSAIKNKCFPQRKNGKKESQLTAGGKHAERYKSRRVEMRGTSSAIMRAQPVAHANLAAFFAVFVVGNNLL